MREPLRIPDFAGAIEEGSGLPRRWRRGLMYGVALVPLCLGVAVVILALVR